MSMTLGKSLFYCLGGFFSRIIQVPVIRKLDDVTQKLQNQLVRGLHGNYGLFLQFICHA